MISTKDKYKKNLKMNGGTIINEADTAVYSTLYATYDDKGLQMLGKVNTNEPQLPFSFAKERKYIVWGVYLATYQLTLGNGRTLYDSFH